MDDKLGNICQSIARAILNTKLKLELSCLENWARNSGTKCNGMNFKIQQYSQRILYRVCRHAEPNPCLSRHSCSQNAVDTRTAEHVHAMLEQV